MSKKTRRSHHKFNRELSRRVVVHNASPSRLLRRSMAFRHALSTLAKINAAQRRRDLLLSDLEDRRRHRRGLRFRTYRTFRGAPARRTERLRIRRLSPALITTLEKDAIVCVRRARRREIMFAKKYAGRGGRQRKHRRNETSRLVCRRR